MPLTVLLTGLVKTFKALKGLQGLLLISSLLKGVQPTYLQPPFQPYTAASCGLFANAFAQLRSDAVQHASCRVFLFVELYKALEGPFQGLTRPLRATISP